MSVAGLVARTILAAALIFSAVLKLRDSDWPTSAKALGVPAWAALLVAPAELTLGALLIAEVAVPVISWLALALLVAFSLVLANALRKPLDERPRCACFGLWSQRPVSVWSILRNAGLAVLAIASAFS